jgi:hypothetical protein
MPIELFAKHNGEESQQSRSVNTNKHDMKVRLKGAL